MDASLLLLMLMLMLNGITPSFENRLLHFYLLTAAPYGPNSQMFRFSPSVLEVVPVYSDGSCKSQSDFRRALMEHYPTMYMN